MDETKVEKRAPSPSAARAGRDHRPPKSISELAPLLAELQLHGDTALFGSGSEQDPDNSDAMIVGVRRKAASDFPTATTTSRTTPSRKKFASVTCSTCRRCSS